MHFSFYQYLALMKQKANDKELLDDDLEPPKISLPVK